MKSIITKTLISTFILFVFLSFLILNIHSNKNNENNNKNENNNNNENENNDKNENKNNTYLYIYDGIVILFILLLIFFVFYNGLYKGCLKSLFIWAFFVLCTPIPEAGLLISLPLKKYFNIRMDICQTFVSLLALVMILYFYYNNKNIVKTNYIGTLFIGLMNYRYYSIIILSVLSSILTSNLIDNIINYYIYDTTINYIYIKSCIIFVFVIIYFYLLNQLINKICK